MKRFALAAMTAAVLCFPVSAGAAVVVPGVTYEGDITTGSGGTVTFTVADDGSTLDFSAALFGTSPCTGNSFGTVPDVPIVDGQASYSAGGISFSVSFANMPGAATGSVSSTVFCNTGHQIWVAETPVGWADAYVSRANQLGAIGQDIYSKSAAEQTRDWSAKRGQARTFEVELQNKGTAPGSTSVKGCSSNRAFKVGYRVDGKNKTGAITSGTYKTGSLSIGGFDEIRMTIEPTDKAKPGKTFKCKVETTGVNAPSFDTVAAALKVKG